VCIAFRRDRPCMVDQTELASQSSTCWSLNELSCDVNPLGKKFDGKVEGGKFRLLDVPTMRDEQPGGCRGLPLVRRSEPFVVREHRLCCQIPNGG